MASSQVSADDEPDAPDAPDAPAGGLAATSTTIRSAPRAAISASSAGRREMTASERRWKTCSGRSSTPSAPYQ
jgi:hypothetical protein